MQPGIVDQHVDSALDRRRLCHHRRNRCLVGDIALEASGEPGIAANLRRRFLGRGAIDIDQHDMRAFRRQRLAEAFAETAPAAGDDGGPALP